MKAKEVYKAISQIMRKGNRDFSEYASYSKLYGVCDAETIIWSAWNRARDVLKNNNDSISTDTVKKLTSYFGLEWW